MKNIFSKIVLVAVLFGLGAGTTYARECTECRRTAAKRSAAQAKASACKRAQSTAELSVNNVRAMINGYGNMWYDGSVAQYHIPKNSNTCPMFCAALWIGGTDVNEQLRLAALRFGSEGDDYWPGPLTIDGAASTDLDRCTKYDKHYIITKADVMALMAMFDYSTNPPTPREGAFDQSAIAEVIMKWPAEGGEAGLSPYLAPFYDANHDGHYDPLAGDYPYYDFDNELCPSSLKAALAPGENYSPRRTMEDSAGVVHGGLLSDQVLKGDQTIWWIFNDMGNTHTETQGSPIGLEIRAQAFGFSTNDEINNMTFYSYEVINRSTYTLKNTYFSQWVDPDLGYAFDDYVGCDVKRGLGYCYNGDESDGPGSGSYSGIPPAVGIDFFQGPYMDPDGRDNPKIDISKMQLYYASDLERYRLPGGVGYDTIKLTDDADLYYPLAWYFQPGDAVGNCAINGVNFGNNIVDDERFGMRRFVYYENKASGYNSEPSKATDYYLYLRGYWKNRQRMKFGGDGLSTGTTTYECDFMFPGDSDPLHWGTDGVDPGFEWTEVQAGNPIGDRRFMQSAGPFTLEPGALNYITVGIPFAQASSGGAWQSVELLRQIDDVCQALFENCFKVLNGPDAPTLVAQEMKNEVILYITYQNDASMGEDYVELDPAIPTYYMDANGTRHRYTDEQRSYKFEGYQIYQLKDAKTSIADISDITKARLVAQCDLENYYDDTLDSPTVPIGTLVNYTTNSTTGLLTATTMVNGANTGLQHVFRIKTDQFSTGTNRALVNNKEYYYVCIAYAHNRYKEYSQTSADLLDGQKEPYLAGRTDEWGRTITPITVIPHDPTNENGGTVVQAEFGMKPLITRIEGHGNGGSVLRLSQESIDELMGAPGVPGKAPGYSVLDTVTGKVSLTDACIVSSPKYQENYGPVNVTVIDPLNIKPGKFVIKFLGVKDNSKWVITKEDPSEPLYYTADSVPVYSDTSDYAIGRYNEQLFLDLGVSVAITNPKPAADSYTISLSPANLGTFVSGGYVNDGSVLSSSMTFSDNEKQWLTGIPDYDGSPTYNWIRSGSQYAAGNLGSFKNSDEPISDYEEYLDEDYYMVTASRGSDVQAEPFDKYQVFEEVLGGLWSPYKMVSTRDFHPGFSMKYFIAPQNILDSLHAIVRYANVYLSYNRTMRKLMAHSCNKSLIFNNVKALPSVRIVFTADTSKWTRCPVLEMCDDYQQSEGNARKFQMRRHPSVDKNGDTSAVRQPSEDPSSPNYISDMGMGWFPGYAINTTTGERLNIMFGEDSRYVQYNGRDMMWNPVNTIMDGTQNYVMGGRHFIYVMNATDQPFYMIFGAGTTVESTSYATPSYDAGRYAMKMLRISEKIMTTTDPTPNQQHNLAYDRGLLKDEIEKASVNEVRDAISLLFASVAWVNMPLVNSRYQFDNPKDIPCDVTIDIDVPTQYATYYGPNATRRPVSEAQNSNRPMYMFELSEDIATLTGQSLANDATKDYRDSILSLINVVPNPYYSYSAYETASQLETKVRFVNVPSGTTISIYTLDGTLVRKLGPTANDSDPTYRYVIDWDLHNHEGIPIAGGMYLIHVDVPNIGYRVIKWFGTMRPVDLNSFGF